MQRFRPMWQARMRHPGKIAPPDEQLLSILLLSHTLKKKGLTISLPLCHISPTRVMIKGKSGRV